MNARIPLRRRRYAEVRRTLLAREEIALLDVREEHSHAQAHPLFAANLPISRLELDAHWKLPRRDVAIVTLDAGEGHAEQAAERLAALGYTDVSVLEGGIDGWQTDGGELFRDVNVPSKAFGELVEAVRHTPSLSADELHRLIDDGVDHVIVDARRFDEYHTMSIPGSISVPGAELALRAPALAPDARTLIVVNCAGRTRSLIGAQSLINAGLPNRVVALRNGTIGWTLAGHALARGQERQAPRVDEAVRSRVAARAGELAERAGVGLAGASDIGAWAAQAGRTTYFFDVRSDDEYRTGHRLGFRPAAGGQLVQETEMFAPVRGARIVLDDDDGVRANMTGSWLAQMGWEVHIAYPSDCNDGMRGSLRNETGPWRPPRPPPPVTSVIEPPALVPWLVRRSAQVIDLGPSAAYRRAHVPGAWFALRSQLDSALDRLPTAYLIVLTADDEDQARFAAQEVTARTGRAPLVLAGGNAAWRAAGLPLESGDDRLASPPIDRYCRPYEGTDAPRSAMQAYLDWELGLLAQLDRDGTHGFRVL